MPFSTSARTGRRLSSLPRTPVAGPLALNERAVAALVSAAIDRVRGEVGTRLELKPSWDGLPGRPASVLEEAISPDHGGYEKGSCPRVEAAAEHLVNLPTHPRVTNRDVHAVQAALASVGY